ncbi:DUF2793 domain-containing protein [Rhodosalinus sediminis]|uniref:DUF2793 domain-containing protein n=1 Tax=Rhodosalinus sediminis TaxID=1940533 RepID=A0A3D9BWA8_9RHOB|nr:DUF2793 domain-containing protein [Rhodosalinus sediminis]REC57805.1 DUF2793 domain-containing protein [Rhodosalinus sediminis]
MSDLSPNLALPLLLPAQAQKHVTHNDALALLDLLVQLRVQRFDARTPPEAPGDGEVYAVGAGATGAWAGQDGRLAARVGGGWVFVAPREGWRAWDVAGAEVRVHADGAWRPLEALPPGTVERLGVNAASDAGNRLAVAAPATLLTHEGAGHQLKIDKASAGDTASLLFQTGFSGRAEMGTAGSDDWSIKVSADGASWTEALRIAAATGVPDLRAGATIGGAVAFHRTNAAGSVSQSGGVPTGALIERGSNANGEYVRFADGTQICTHRQMSSSSSNATWTYPAEFAPGKTDCLLGTATPMTGTNVVSVVQSTTGSAIFTIRDTLNYGVRIEADVWLFAMGRWF